MSQLQRPVKQMRPSEIIGLQRKTIRELEELVNVLKGALAAEGIEVSVARHSLLRGLSPQEGALMGALYAAYPRPISGIALTETLPGRDHVADRQPQLASVKICHIRKKLGKDVVKNIHGLGYVMGAAFYERMRGGGENLPLAA